MFINTRSVGAVLLSLIFMSASVWASPTGVEGTIKDPKGQTIKGANIKIEAKDSSGFSKTIQSDARGHYSFAGLSGGKTYRVTLLVNGAVKASINNVKAQLGESTKLNFDLKEGTTAVKKKATHMVYIPGQTGTHLGGRWVEVDDNGQADTVDVFNVKRAGAGAVTGLQGNSGTSKGGN